MSKRSCRRALDADHGPANGWNGYLFGPLGPPGPFSPFWKTHLFKRKIGRRLCLKKLDFCIPWRGPKSENVTKHTMKLMISLSRLGPKKGPVSKHLGPRGPPKGALFGPMDRSDSDPFRYCFFPLQPSSFQGPLFQFKLPPETSDLAKCILFTK